jgi:hypothetical protein
LAAILQINAGRGNGPRREETMEETTDETMEETTSAFVSSVGSQATSKSIASPTNIYSSGGI